MAESLPSFSPLPRWDRSHSSALSKVKHAVIIIGNAVLVFAISALIVWQGYLLTHRALWQSGDLTSAQLPCRNLPGANETVIILKTGSTALEDRLPVHLYTTLRCFPLSMIFSDHGEVFGDRQIFDALEFVNPELLESHPDFELHRRLKQAGRKALASSELSTINSKAKSPTGHVENPGWKLDKWKFLPMMNRTLQQYPHMKWYVFVEADTYILWSSLLQYLAALDPTKPRYLGSQMFIGGDVFAHGGSGFIVSQPAMQRVVNRFAVHTAEIDKLTDAHWAGDCVLGRTFRDAGVPFTNAWPIMQGDYPGKVPYARPDGRPVADNNKRLWCFPSVSYHHLAPSIVEDLWHFEQDWIASHPLNATTSTSPIRHRDVFTHYILPRMSPLRIDWDSESNDDQGPVGSIEECRSKCEAAPECRQFSVDTQGQCRTRIDPRLGRAAARFQSGWIMDRVARFAAEMAPCGEEGWLV